VELLVNQLTMRRAEVKSLLGLAVDHIAASIHHSSVPSPTMLAQLPQELQERIALALARYSKTVGAFCKSAPGSARKQDLMVVWCLLRDVAVVCVCACACAWCVWSTCRAEASKKREPTRGPRPPGRAGRICDVH
jgi:hypothetical protein